MNAIRTTPGDPHGLIDAAIAAHGATRVLLRAARALLAGRPRPPDPGSLSDHLRRDIGLPPARDAPWPHRPF